MTDPDLVALQASRTASPKRVYRRGRQVCRYCEAQLGALARARGVCDDRQCRKRDRQLRDQIRRERDEIEMAAMRAAAAKAVEEEARLLERLRSDASRELSARDPKAPVLKTSEIATTCHTTTPLVDLPHEFAEDFRNRMLTMVRDIFEQQDEEREQGREPAIEEDGVLVDQDDLWVADMMFKTFSDREKLERPVHATETAGCAACRGRCCEGGYQNLAYLRPADVARFRARNPGATPDSMVAAYFEFLPDKHVQHSCVFHGEFGCTIPREMRNNICNGYKCFWLLSIEETVNAGQPPRVVAAFKDHRPQRAFYVEEDGALTELAVDNSISSAEMIEEAADAVKDTAPDALADQVSLSVSGRGGTSSLGASAGGTGS